MFRGFFFSNHGKKKKVQIVFKGTLWKCRFSEKASLLLLSFFRLEIGWYQGSGSVLKVMAVSLFSKICPSLLVAL